MRGAVSLPRSVEHLGVAEADASRRRHRHDPCRSVRGARHRQRHQDVLGGAVPSDQRALVGDGGAGVVGNVGTTTARPRRARDVEQRPPRPTRRAPRQSTGTCARPWRPPPGESYSPSASSIARPANNTETLQLSPTGTTCHVYYARRGRTGRQAAILNSFCSFDGRSASAPLIRAAATRPTRGDQAKFSFPTWHQPLMCGPGHRPSPVGEPPHRCEMP